jgi:hypothetical protein
MTFNNSILLILKQNQGIDFNELFSKISSRYGNVASATAALSRALKNLESMGQIKRKEDNVFITDKGLATIQIEMKEKLVLKLNETMKKPLENIEEIVQLLIVLTERANEASDLLQNARENAQFTITEISELQEKIEERKDFLDKMASLIGAQEERLRELNFNDRKEIDFDKDSVKTILSIFKEEKLEKIILETNDSELNKKIPEIWKKGNDFVVETEFVPKLFEILLDEKLAESVIFFSGIKGVIKKGKVTLFGEYNKLKNIK